MKGDEIMGFVKDNFEVLDSLAKCIAIQFGANCEVVLHDRVHL